MTTRRAARNNDKALDAFIAAKAEIDTMLARLQALSGDHFGFDPDAINWGAVGSINSVAVDLRKITDFLFGEGEHAA
ncbi:hypothetical protein [Thetidibacter halocola]|uniref:Uncharacterized protein n=1 Tax=Thetidibacter halocola TaxID=2827239 RepID=A0A8J7WHD9_9RHOB|nr:hypothetical protein [Thetidibacter halocola]MBS0126867.1 hypothetical protein [Thetidibacter halocola]